MIFVSTLPSDFSVTISPGRLSALRSRIMSAQASYCNSRVRAYRLANVSSSKTLCTNLPAVGQPLSFKSAQIDRRDSPSDMRARTVSSKSVLTGPATAQRGYGLTTPLRIESLVSTLRIGVIMFSLTPQKVGVKLNRGGGCRSRSLSFPGSGSGTSPEAWRGIHHPLGTDRRTDHAGDRGQAS